mmetsp:Transcript_16510/g.23175  ORF Transcript_16510/g.23175 Transcript_16510/m.23175 type:complete len:102 (-) Transcript_16510:251-556(-)
MINNDVDGAHCNIVVGASGSFEVIVKGQGKVLYSKLEKKRFPNPEDVVVEIEHLVENGGGAQEEAAASEQATSAPTPAPDDGGPGQSPSGPKGGTCECVIS